MLTASEMRAVSNLIDAMDNVFAIGIKLPTPLEIAFPNGKFSLDIHGGPNGEKIGSIEMVDSEVFEFVPVNESD